MPQIFQVLRCYKCLVFQVHQTKKSNKFACKLCSEKQSIKRHYGIGTAKDCRLHVQKLNGIRGEIDEVKEAIDSDSDENNSLDNHIVQSYPKATQVKSSKWAEYVDKNEEEVSCGDSKDTSNSENMYLDNTEVTLENPKKRKNNNFKCPKLGKPTVAIDVIKEESLSYPDSAMFSYNNTISKPLDCNKGNNNEVLENYIPTPTRKYLSDQVPIGKVSELVPSTVNSNSKWAQFVDDEIKEVFDDDNLILSNEDCEVPDTTQSEENCFEDSSNVHSNSQALFALCDESELDSVLDI